MRLKYHFMIRNALAALLLCVLLMPLHSQHRMVAEWEPMQGVLIRHPFGIPLPLIRSLAEIDTVYVLVANANAQSQAAYTLSSENVNLSNCRFVIAPTNSHWTRDWGPHSMFLDDLTPAIADPHFDGYPWVPGFREDRAYELDNAVNGILASYLDIALQSFPGYLTGGNFMSDGFGTAYSTAQMISENMSLMNSDQFLLYAQDILGISDYRFTINPELHGIQHIDCWAKLLNEETVLVKELPVGHPEYARAEAIADQFAQSLSCFGNPLRVIRIYCDTYSGTNAAAYTNSLIINKRVFVPTFGIAADQQALQTYADAMPGYEILGFDGAWYYYDALHCRTMGIADIQMLRIIHHPPRAITEIDGNTYSIEASVKSYGNFAQNPGYPKLYFKRAMGAQWESISMQALPQPNHFEAIVTDLANGDELLYYIVGSDTSGRIQSLPITAPEQIYRTFISSSLDASDEYFATPIIKLYPMPTRDYLFVETNTKSQLPQQLTLFDLRGRSILSQSFLPHEKSLKLDLKDIPTGLYILRIETPKGSLSRKVMIIK